MKKDNFTKLYEMVLDSYEDMEKMFSESEIRAINQGKKPWVVFALDRLFSGWGKSQNESNHVLVVCWSHEQRFNIEQSLKDAHEMSYVTSSSLEHFITTRHNRRGTWSIKNANDCAAWNKGLKEEI